MQPGGIRELRSRPLVDHRAIAGQLIGHARWAVRIRGAPVQLHGGHIGHRGSDLCVQCATQDPVGQPTGPPWRSSDRGCLGPDSEGVLGVVVSHRNGARASRASVNDLATTELDAVVRDGRAITLRIPPLEEDLAVAGFDLAEVRRGQRDGVRHCGRLRRPLAGTCLVDRLHLEGVARQAVLQTRDRAGRARAALGATAPADRVDRIGAPLASGVFHRSSAVRLRRAASGATPVTLSGTAKTAKVIVPVTWRSVRVVSATSVMVTVKVILPLDFSPGVMDTVVPDACFWAGSPLACSMEMTRGCGSRTDEVK